ncbi:MAG: hypothetical protein WA183_05355 [Chthoniobacterales bacterium]
MNPLSKFFGLKNRRQLRELAKKTEFGMTTRQEQHWLRTYTAQRYRGIGAIVDLGCFLGATTISLAEGLSLNPETKEKQIHAYDLFRWNEGYEAWAKGKEVEDLFIPGGSFLPEFLRRTQKWQDYIVVHEGDLSRTEWKGGPIEFLFVDAMKSPQVSTAIASNFFPHLICAQSYVAHQDFPHAFTPWIHFLVFRLRDYFQFVADLPQSSLFRLEKKIDPEILARDLSPAAVSPDEIEAAFDYSISLVRDEKKGNIVAAKAMAYSARREFARAHDVMAQSRHGPASLADEFKTVKGLIEQKLEAPKLSGPGT